MSQKPKKRNPAPSRPEGTRTEPPKPARSALAPVGDEVEPQTEAVPMPIWPFVALLVLVYWAMLHLDRYAGGFSEMVYGPYQSYKQLADIQPKSGPEMLIAKGESLYGIICSQCHQPTGLGSPGQYPPLAGSEWAQGPAARVIRIPLHGLTGTITVKGEAWNASMPAFGGGPPLDNDENLAAVLTYVRQAWGNKADPITPDQVKAVRAETASRSSPWTADELLKVQ